MQDERTQELVAIGAAITANCQPCLDYHVAKARDIGVTDADIRDAIAIGKQVRRGAAGKMDRHAADRVGSEVSSPHTGECR